MADVLLAHSYHLAYDPKQLRKMQPYPPLGTLYAASALMERGIATAVFDPMLREPFAGLAEAIERHRPRIAAIYEDDFNFLSKMCLTRMREIAWRIAAQAGASGALVIAHGSDATDQAQDYLSHGVDYILLGEAEETLADLCAMLLRGQDPDGIPGLVRRNPSGKILKTPPARPRSSFWTGLAKPARELIDLEPYRLVWKEAHGFFSTNVVSSRGCPYHCNWCAKPISGSVFHARPAKAVASEIRELRDLHGVEHIWFGDDIFALNRHWVHEFASAMVANECVLPFKIQSRADLMSEETVAELKRAGCAEVWMGVESGSQKILDSMEKGLLVSEVISARGRLRDAGIRACYFLQFGYPGETWEDILRTVDLVRATRPWDIGVSLSYPLPGTGFYQRVQAELGGKRNWRDSDDLCVMFRGAYCDEFYRALRDALHAEVESWRSPLPGDSTLIGALWKRVELLEISGRRPDPWRASTEAGSPSVESISSESALARATEA